MITGRPTQAPVDGQHPLLAKSFWGFMLTLLTCLPVLPTCPWCPTHNLLVWPLPRGVIASLLLAGAGGGRREGGSQWAGTIHPDGGIRGVPGEAWSWWDRPSGFVSYLIVVLWVARLRSARALCCSYFCIIISQVSQAVYVCCRRVAIQTLEVAAKVRLDIVPLKPWCVYIYVVHLQDRD